HDHPLGAAGLVGRAEYRNTAAPHAGQVADRFLELVGADVAAAADDDVFFASGDVEAAFGQVGAIAGIHPFAVEQAFGRLLIAVITAGGRGAAELELSFVAVGELEPRAVDHAQVVIGQHQAAGDHLQ